MVNINKVFFILADLREKGAEVSMPKFLFQIYESVLPIKEGVSDNWRNKPGILSLSSFL